MSPHLGCFWLLVAVGCGLANSVSCCNPEGQIWYRHNADRLSHHGLPFLPVELASLVKQMSYYAFRAKHAEFLGHRFRIKADRNRALLHRHTETLKKKSAGLVPLETIDGFTEILSWNVVIPLTMIHYNAAKTKLNSTRFLDSLSSSLVRNIARMVDNITVCELYNAFSQAERCDRVHTNYIDFHFNEISGTPIVRRVLFHKSNPLRIGSQFEDADIEQVFNGGSEPITLRRTYTERHGRTTSVTRAIQFGAKVSASATFGFKFFGVEASTSFSFETSVQSSTTFTGEIMKETTVQREYTFIVAPGESAIISVKQGQLNLRLRYTVELDFNGFVKNMTGIWEGTANSNIEVSYTPLVSTVRRYDSI